MNATIMSQQCTLKPISETWMLFFLLKNSKCNAVWFIESQYQCNIGAREWYNVPIPASSSAASAAGTSTSPGGGSSDMAVFEF